METILLFEIMGTATLVLLGVGVVANALLPGTKGHGGGWLLINFGWGLGVFAGVYVAWGSGATSTRRSPWGCWPPAPRSMHRASR